MRTHISAVTHRGIKVFEVSRLHYFYSDSKYVTAVCDNREIELGARESLDQLEKEFMFLIRISKNTLVPWFNIIELKRRINDFQKTELEVILTTGERVRASHLYRDSVCIRIKLETERTDG